LSIRTDLDDKPLGERMNKQEKEKSRLRDKLNVFVLAFGAMIGWGWVLLSGEWIQRAGTLGAIIAFIAGGIVVLFVSQIYAELTAAMPHEGGVMVFSSRAFGKTVSFVCVWALLLGYIAVVAFESVALPTVLSFIFPETLQGYMYTIAGYDVYATWVIIGILSSLVIACLNVFGMKVVATFQTFLTIAILTIGVIFFAGAATNGSTANMQPLFNSGTAGVLAVFVMTPFMYVGFDVIPQSASEIRLPQKRIGNLLVFSVVVAILWYVLIIAGVGATLNETQRNTSLLVTADAMASAYGGKVWASNLLIIGGVAGILTCWNSFYTGCSRAIAAMAREKMLPQCFAKKHKKYGTPYNAIILICIVTTIAPFFGRNMLIWLSNAGGFGTIITYLIVSISFLVLRKKEPSLERPYKIKHPKFIGIASIVSCACIIVFLFIPGMKSALSIAEWVIIFAWVLLGFILYGLQKLRMDRKRK